MKNEEWRDIAGYEGAYQISSFGRVRSLDREVDHFCHHSGNITKMIRKGHVMKPGSSPGGYTISSLTLLGKPRHFTVHRLVANAFIPNPENKPQINHKDSNRKNNHIDNLEWCTASENANHCISKGRSNQAYGSDCYRKLDELQVKVIKDVYSQGGISYKQLGNYFKVGATSIGSIIRGKNYKYIL